MMKVGELYYYAFIKKETEELIIKRERLLEEIQNTPYGWDYTYIFKSAILNTKVIGNLSSEIFKKLDDLLKKISEEENIIAIHLGE